MRDPIDDLTIEELRRIVREIRSILWPFDTDEENDQVQWDSDTPGDIAAVLRDGKV